MKPSPENPSDQSTGHWGEDPRRSQIWDLRFYPSRNLQNESESVELRWMNLEAVIQSEAGQREEDKYCNINKWYRWVCFQGRSRDADMENGPVDTVGKGEGGMSREGSTEARPLPRAKRTAGGKLLWGRGAQLSALWWPGAGAEGWERGSRETRIYVYSELIHADVRQKPTQLCKAIIPQLKLIFLKRERNLHSHWHETACVFPRHRSAPSVLSGNGAWERGTY